MSQRAAPAADTVVLDYTAQMDLRLIGNVGNTINIQDPLVNGAGTLLGNSSPNGAMLIAEGLKDNFSFGNPTARIVQLFQVDNGPGLEHEQQLSHKTVSRRIWSGPEGILQCGFSYANERRSALPEPGSSHKTSNSSPGNPFLP